MLQVSFKFQDALSAGNRIATMIKSHLLKIAVCVFRNFILTTVFHICTEKKLRTPYLSPQLCCFFNLFLINSLKSAGSTTSTSGPNDKTRMTISGSSSPSYLMTTL